MYRIPQLLEKPHYSSTTRSPELCCLFLWHKAALLSGKDSTLFQANTAWLCKNMTWKTRMKNHEMLQDWYLGSNPPDATRICLGTMKTWAVSLCWSPGTKPLAGSRLHLRKPTLPDAKPLLPWSSTGASQILVADGKYWWCFLYTWVQRYWMQD